MRPSTQLLDYCQLSAAPVGELVLRVFGAATPERIALSDRVCAGLQVVEHLQDIAEDHRRGRVYMPREDLARFGCDEEDLDSAAPPAASAGADRVRVAPRAGAARQPGAPLARTLPPAPRIAVAGFVAGGRAALPRSNATTASPGARADAGRSHSPAAAREPRRGDDDPRDRDRVRLPRLRADHATARRRTSTTASACCRASSARRCARSTRSRGGSTTSATRRAGSPSAQLAALARERGEAR